jgi:uracil-DNA glycosylase
VPHRSDWIATFVADLSRATIGSTTNQYSVSDPELDREGGAAIRTANLIAYLERRQRPRLMLVGEAPSYRGCRFSGLAFTSERSLPADRWSSRKPAGWQEPSATIVHEALDELGVEDQTLLWNACPTHPPGPSSLSNRPPTEKELAEGIVWLRRLVDLAQPDLIVTVGQLASRSLPGAIALRHPSHGGKPKFRRGLVDLLTAASQT